MKILIVGGGVGGLALARFLKGKAEVTLIDKAPAFGNIGYAIALWGNGQKILKQLGIDKNVLKDSYEMPWNAFQNKRGKLLQVFTFDTFKKFGPTVVVTRSILQQALIKNIEKKIKIKFATTVKEIKNGKDGALVVFSSGEAENFDLVVGADGIHSSIREMVFGKDFLKYYGWSVFAFWIPKTFVPPNGALEFSSGNKLCFIYPMKDSAVVMLAMTANPEDLKKNEVTKEFLHQNFKGFKNLVGDLIDGIEDPGHIFRDNLAHIEMESWYKERVALLGDAKHAISPLTGMGASMALEDASVLAEELLKNNNVDIALKNYELRRDKRVRRFHKAAMFVEGWLIIKSPFMAFLRDIFITFIPVSFFTRPIEKVLAEEI